MCSWSKSLGDCTPLRYGRSWGRSGVYSYYNTPIILRNRKRCQNYHAAADGEAEEAEVAVGRGRKGLRVAVARITAAPPDLTDEAGLHEQFRPAHVALIFDADFEFTDRQDVGVAVFRFAAHAIVDGRGRFIPLAEDEAEIRLAINGEAAVAEMAFALQGQRRAPAIRYCGRSSNRFA